jgi:hypothetical protein
MRRLLAVCMGILSAGAELNFIVVMSGTRHSQGESMMIAQPWEIAKPRRAGQTYAVWPLTNDKFGDVISRTAYPDLALPIWRAEIPSRSPSTARGLCEHDPCIFA